MIKKIARRLKIKASIRTKVNGTAERPRLTVFRSNSQIYAQVINDLEGKTLASASSLAIKDKLTKTEKAAEVGKLIAAAAIKAGVSEVVFLIVTIIMQRVKTTQDLELKERLVAVNRVTKVTKGGRTFTFAAIVVVGNEDGIVGYGLGKAGEVAAAMQKATEAAKKNLIQVPVLKGTIPHEQFAKFGGSQVYIQPATHGTGVKAGGAMRAVLESAGVHDVLAKSKGSSNPHNLVKATIQALAELRDARTVAANRGVSLSTVFNG